MARGEHSFLGGSAAAWDKQFVWPRDKNGRTPRNWWDGFKDILSNRGPDIFVTRKNDRTPIKPDLWGNWDGYDSPEAQARELRQIASRRNKRYEPKTRKYVVWEFDDNYANEPHRKFPIFTSKEHDWMARHPGRRPKPDWSRTGPKRYRKEHNDFWKSAFRVGENIRAGVPEESTGLNSRLYMSDAWLNLYDTRRGRPPHRRAAPIMASPFANGDDQYMPRRIARPVYDYGPYDRYGRYDEDDDSGYEDVLPFHRPYRF